MIMRCLIKGRTTGKLIYFEPLQVEDLERAAHEDAEEELPREVELEVVEDDPQSAGSGEARIHFDSFLMHL